MNLQHLIISQVELLKLSDRTKEIRKLINFELTDIELDNLELEIKQIRNILESFEKIGKIKEHNLTLVKE